MDQLPNTEQGLKDYVRFSDSEIKRCERKIKALHEAKAICNQRLTVIEESKRKEVEDVKATKHTSERDQSNLSEPTQVVSEAG